MSAPTANPAQPLTAKESFSGPSNVIGAAKEAARLKFGERPGGWSRWLVEAITEKLQSENPELLQTLRALGTADAQPELSEIHAKLDAHLASLPPAQARRFRAEFDALLAASKRTVRRTAAA